MNKKNYLLPLFCSFLLVNALRSQDIHFSQYYNSPLNISPALTGMFNGDMRFMGNYRSQWTSVPVDYKTYTAAFDMKYFHEKFENGFFGGGILLNTDRAGDSELGNSQIDLGLAYAQRLNEFNIVSIGFQAGYGQRSFEPAGLTFGNQFNGDVYSPDESSRENFDQTDFGFLNIGAGINWRLQLEEGLRKFDVGIGTFHLNRPAQGFDEATPVDLPVRLSFYTAGEYEFNEVWAGVFHGIGQVHGPYTEVIAGGGAKYWLNRDRGKETAVQLGTAYRFRGISDAIIPSLQLQYQAWQFGLSYDINLSQFEVATANRGGLELSLIYIITKVKPTKEIKSCPVF